METLPSHPQDPHKSAYGAIFHHYVRHHGIYDDQIQYDQRHHPRQSECLAETPKILADIHASRRLRFHIIPVNRHSSVLLLLLQQNETELENHRREIHHPHTVMGDHIGAVSLREELAWGE